MESFGISGCWDSIPVKRRSNTHRKPRIDPHLLSDGFAAIPPFVAPPSSNNPDKQYPENRRKINNLKIVVLKNSSRHGMREDHKPNVRQSTNNGEDLRSVSSNQRNHNPELKRCIDGATVLSSKNNICNEKKKIESMAIFSDDQHNRQSTDVRESMMGKCLDGLAEIKSRKMKFKVGVTAPGHTEGSVEGNCAVTPYSTSAKKLKIIHKGHDKIKEDVLSTTSNLDSIRKSERVRRKHSVFEDDTKQVLNFESSRNSKDKSLKHVKDVSDGNIDKKNMKILKKKKTGYYEDEDYEISNDKKPDGKKSKSDIEIEEASHIQDNGRGCSDASEAKELDEESLCSSIDKKEFSLVTRRRALQSCKGDAGGSLLEFPNGLPSPPQRRQKVQLSEVERHIKKAEAAQRRRMQLEKAARESEAEAIRKILGHDSSKKREDKLRQKLQQRAQERAANSSTLAPTCVRWVIGPTGTTVVFPEGAELPSIFNSGPCSYPPPREKCAGPSCNNPYKYRDSKTNLPLCSLGCYRAVQQINQHFCVR